MATPLKSKPVQDMPPPGGFKPFSVAAEMPKPRISGFGLFALTAATCAVGFYIMGQGNIERRALKMEKRERRMAIVPFLQAEEDARFVRLSQKAKDEEARIMKDVPGWDVNEKVYNTQSWFVPTHVNNKSLW
ncbi:NADH dehydrogenase ubiquinone 1 alpha subcomplex subunit 13 [Hondaea fermentalgiana]|uniref:NADH dehydrogenase [ubiquinone] 1 alpha subcomplex subunit 13 n=1 Tax=Hondaea fermentalgiana TaxID=2315210 RepID=A0A2R5GT60_9STRA|nr:NADH dehydrogenase ubiquinone 1 alpha subcomplex subunit 13 [Hondaea fermentalgiana]|eukprot:GBG32948.1 NADH dehydrogenase ubiquinone 1 alpha subcomplex subunit 13 [Hondaea fermentalgiana]